jgi:hypothetical protein
MNRSRPIHSTRIHLFILPSASLRVQSFAFDRCKSDVQVGEEIGVQAAHHEERNPNECENQDSTCFDRRRPSHARRSARTPTRRVHQDASRSETRRADSSGPGQRLQPRRDWQGALRLRNSHHDGGPESVRQRSRCPWRGEGQAEVEARGEVVKGVAAIPDRGQPENTTRAASRICREGEYGRRHSHGRSRLGRRCAIRQERAFRSGGASDRFPRSPGHEGHMRDGEQGVRMIRARYP